MNETYYIEIHKARKMFALVKKSMELVDKLGISPVLKNELKVELNKVMQFLSLKNLKVIDGNGNPATQRNRIDGDNNQRTEVVGTRTQ